MYFVIKGHLNYAHAEVCECLSRARHHQLTTSELVLEGATYSSRIIDVVGISTVPQYRKTTKMRVNFEEHVPGEIRAPGFTVLDEPQRDDLTTNRQGPSINAVLRYIVFQCSFPP